MPINLSLPLPWPSGTTFQIEELPRITWLVGPNGTGKSKFLRALRDHREVAPLQPRLLSTDRLAGVRTDENTRGLFGDHFADGVKKSHFDRHIAANHKDGAIAGTVTLIHRRPDLRIRLEATLSQLLNRHIRLEMTDGNLTPKVRCGASPEYGMFGEECHGVLELLALLANVYDDETNLLLIDEPELNLHPQYQAFVLDEIRRAGKKVILATHSPSFLKVKTVEDLRGVICFHADFSVPSMYRSNERIDREVQEILPRMTEQHRAFFFASRPVFVEGYFDAVVISGIQSALGMSAEAAGSSLVPTAGKDEAGRYLMLCNALGKDATFVFDLDALFDRRLSAGANQIPALADRVASAGHGTYSDLVGRLQQALTEAVKTFVAVPDDQLPAPLEGLRVFMNAHPNQDDLNRRRVALLVALAAQPAALRTLTVQVDAIRGFLEAVRTHLAAVHIYVLPGGALENYLPSYEGNRFDVPDDAKRATVTSELSWLAATPSREDILARYADLGTIIQALPSKARVDIRPVLRREIANLLHHLVMAVREGQVRTPEDAKSLLGEPWTRVANFLDLSCLDVVSTISFSGQLRIADKFSIGAQMCRFSEATQTNDPASLVLERLDEAARAAT